MNRLRNLSKAQITSYILIGVSAIMLLLSVYMTINVDVVDNWRLVLPNQTIHVNDEITVSSEYVKKMNVKGVSTRYLDCQNKNGVIIRYELNKRIADRAARAGGTGIVVRMPDTVVDLPAKCKIAVVIDYEVFKFRHVIETNETAEFTLYPIQGTTSATSSADSSQRTSQIQSPSSNQSSNVSSSAPLNPSSSNHTAEPEPQQSDISQKGLVSNLLDEATKTVNDLIGGL